eukprot:6624698-Prymnesium_polylepis.2
MFVQVLRLGRRGLAAHSELGHAREADVRTRTQRPVAVAERPAAGILVRRIVRRGVPPADCRTPSVHKALAVARRQVADRGRRVKVLLLVFCRWPRVRPHQLAQPREAQRPQRLGHQMHERHVKPPRVVDAAASCPAERVQSIGCWRGGCKSVQEQRLHAVL